MSNIKLYVNTINDIYITQTDTEHSYRNALQSLLISIFSDINDTIQVINEPKRRGFGAPDFVINKGELILGYVETKQVGDGDLDGNRHNKEQFTRYKLGVGNIIFTDYLDFHFYQNAEKIAEVRIAEEYDDSLRIVRENIDAFIIHLRNFCSYSGEVIISPDNLAKIMANKSRILANAIHKSLESDAKTNTESALMSQYNTIKDNLLAEINHKDYSDMYAQTVVYGLFAARYNTENPDNFVRIGINELIPASIPFLQNLFVDIAVRDLDVRIRWIIDDLVAVFRQSDMEAIMANYGLAEGRRDPIIHFYEDYLNEYAPELRQSRGVWYTPDAVVDFIVRAVDEILQTEFDLQNGLANIEKIGELNDAVHKVQILDPATGTGTFLAKVIDIIYDKLSNQRGAWSNYVVSHLLPRLNGFELLMASYAIAHLNVFHKLKDTGYDVSKTDERVRIFLTNSLENPIANEQRAIPFYLANEANEAAKIKQSTPIMCIIGNPPYNVSSCNSNLFINKFIRSYTVGVILRNTQPLSDDYIKFIRLAQDYICRNGSGVVAFITNNSFIKGLVHHKMRESLMCNFDKIYIIDLHGSTREQEQEDDQNVFNIQQGVSINIFVKKELNVNTNNCQVYHYELIGRRKEKLNFLKKNTLSTIKFNTITPAEPNYFFDVRNFINKEEYEQGFKIDDLFVSKKTGIVTGDDNTYVGYTRKELTRKIQKAEGAYEDTRNKKILYRAFDFRYFYDKKEDNPNSRHRHFLNMTKGKNIALITSNQFASHQHFVVLVTKGINARSSLAYAPYWNFPLFVYVQNADGTYQKLSNLNCDVKNKIVRSLGLKFKIDEPEEPVAEEERNFFTSVELFDYIYAVLHSPAYRQKYEEFINIDFPRVPYPTDIDKFRKLASLGEKLRKVHLFEANFFSDNQSPTGFPIGGSNRVENVQYNDCRVYINDTQYFSNVSSLAWEMFIGGYQPAQKYLTDRKHRELDFDEISHYCCIIRALEETDRLMTLIDEQVPEI